MLVPSLKGVVGTLVLPILGAVPDGAIVLFSGMGPQAQAQLSVGVGALAGSTIMLLTLTWGISISAPWPLPEHWGAEAMKRWPHSARPGARPRLGRGVD